MAWRLTHPERVVELRAQPDQRAKDQARVKAWVKANPDRAKAMHKNKPSAKDRAKQAEYRRRWKEKDPLRASLVTRESQVRRRVAKMGGKVTKADYAAILLEFGLVCHICGLPIEGNFHFDHVIPLAAGGAHARENLRPAHAFCNQTKSDRVFVT